MTREVEAFEFPEMTFWILSWIFYARLEKCPHPVLLAFLARTEFKSSEWHFSDPEEIVEALKCWICFKSRIDICCTTWLNDGTKISSLAHVEKGDSGSGQAKRTRSDIRDEALSIFTMKRCPHSRWNTVYIRDETLYIFTLEHCPYSR